MSATFLGLTLTQTLVVVGAILVVIDLFFLSDLPTMGAYVAFASAIALQFNLPILVQILIGVVAFVLLIIFHYAVWRGVFRRITERVAPGRYQNSVDRVVGQKGTIRFIEGRSLVSVNSELWDHDGGDTLPAGTPVEVLARLDSVLSVRAVGPVPAPRPIPSESER